VRVLVTGGSGFIGTNAIDLFLSRGHTVESWDISPPRKAQHTPLWRRVDIRATSEVGESLRTFSPTHVVHLAARTDLKGLSLAAYDVNVRGTANVLAGAESSPTVTRLLIASSRLVCRLGYQPVADDDYQPDTYYGESKVAMERLVRETSVSASWAIVRPTSIWGPWFGTPYRDFFTAIAAGRYLHPKGAAIPKSFGFVGNVAHQLYNLCTTEPARVDRRMFYLADYEAIDVLEFATEIQHALRARRVRSVPTGVLRFGALVGDALLRAGVEEPPLTRFRLKNLLTPMVYDLEPLRRVVGSTPYTVKEGIDLSVAWLKEERLV
jgi:nucleoside-diphosphate-sugar epimerase